MDRSALTSLIRSQLEERDICDRAGTCVLEGELRERLAAVAVEPDPNIGVALMAVAMLLAEHAPEWGGDSRDALAEVAQLGLSLLLSTEELP